METEEKKERKKRTPKPVDDKILVELKEQTELLKKIMDILDAQWRGRNPA